MGVLDYESGSATRSSPLLGRIAALLLGLFIVSYAIAIVAPSPHSERLIACLVIFLLLDSAAATVVSLIAVSRKKTRTVLARITFLLCAGWWLIYLVLFLGGM
jgi:hypothetical protein